MAFSLDCIADPEIAAGLPSGEALGQLFPDALQRRAAEHIRVHAQDPAAGGALCDGVVRFTRTRLAGA